MSHSIAISCSILEEAHRKASKLNSSDEIGDLIQRAISTLLTSIENDVDPEKLKHNSSTVLSANCQGNIPIHVLSYDLLESMNATMGWIADREIERRVKSEIEDRDEQDSGAWSDDVESSEDDDDRNDYSRKPPRKKKSSSRNDKSTKCDECGKHFTTAGTLRVHKLTHLNDADAKRPYACDQCDKRFTQAGSLSVHKRKHLAADDPRLQKYQTVWKCETCGYECNNRSVLWAHNKLHLGEEERRSFYKCQYCGKGFTQRTGLVQHERLHTRDYPHKCNLCPRKFIRSFELRDHLAEHAKGTAKLSGKVIRSRNHKCTLCPKKFRRDYDLAAHLKRHADNTVGSSSDEADEFKCNQCEKTFTTQELMDKHLTSHNPSSLQYSCTFCNYKYLTKGPLDKHMNSVHAAELKAFARKKRFTCAHCPSKYRTEFELEYHKKSHVSAQL